MKRPRRGKGIKEILKKANKFLKDTKLISKTAGAIAPHVQWVKPIEMLSKSYGYGKRARKPRARYVRKPRTSGAMRRKGVRRGKGKFMDFLRKANDWLKKTKIISTVANAAGTVLPVAGSIGKVASAAGYGRKRKMRRGRGIGHVYTPQSGVGIAGTATYSKGRVQF